jgi:hypothetical protein
MYEKSWPLRKEKIREGISQEEGEKREEERRLL